MSFFPNTDAEGARQPLTIPLPFLRQSIGSGDMVKRMADALSIRQCGGCEQRQETMNRKLQFRPMRGGWET